MILSGNALLEHIKKKPLEIKCGELFNGKELAGISFDGAFHKYAGGRVIDLSGITFKGLSIRIESPWDYQFSTQCIFDFSGSEWVDCSLLYHKVSSTDLIFGGHFYRSAIVVEVYGSVSAVSISGRMSECSFLLQKGNSQRQSGSFNKIILNDLSVTCFKSFELQGEVESIYIENSAISPFDQGLVIESLLSCEKFTIKNSIISGGVRLSNQVFEVVLRRSSIYNGGFFPKKYRSLKKMRILDVVIASDFCIENEDLNGVLLNVEGLDVVGDFELQRKFLNSLILVGINANRINFRKGLDVGGDVLIGEISTDFHIYRETSIGGCFEINNVVIPENCSFKFYGRVECVGFIFSSLQVEGVFKLPVDFSSKSAVFDDISIAGSGEILGQRSTFECALEMNFKKVSGDARLAVRQSEFKESVSLKFEDEKSLSFSCLDFSESLFTTLHVDNVKLNCIPNFIGSSFDTKPVVGRIDCSRFYDGRVDIDVFSVDGEEDKNAYLKAIAMKNLAEDNKDHHKVLAYHGAEMRARRFNTMTYPASIFDFLFSVMSNYGQSIGRPLTLLAGIFIIFFAAYGSFLFQSGSACGLYEVLVYTASSPLSFIPDAKEANKSFVNLCVLNGADLSLDVKDKIFGFYILSKLQGFLSVVCLFLLFLALRNRFRIG